MPLLAPPGHGTQVVILLCKISKQLSGEVSFVFRKVIVIGGGQHHASDIIHCAVDFINFAEAIGVITQYLLTYNWFVANEDAFKHLVKVPNEEPAV